MLARRILAAIAVTSAAAVVVVPVVFAGEPAKKDAAPVASGKAAAGKKGEPAGPRRDPDNVTALSQFMATLIDGNALYAQKNYAGAADTFKKAMALNPKHALGPYALGEAQVALGELPQAEESFKLAESLTDDRDPGLRARVMFVLADVKERQKKLDEAKVAWTAYQEYASKHADAGVWPNTATTRLQLLDDLAKMEKAYVAVRERIAAEKAEAGAEGGSAADAGAKK